MTVPRVSVIVLNHNGEEIIGKCIEHLLAQTFGDFEIIVVDNNSSDGSLAVLEEYSKRGRIGVVRSGRNQGVAGGRNLGLRHARGTIIAFIDNDGFAHPQWLASAVETLDSDPRIGAAASVVFFAGRKIVLNGAGGTVNRQGYGADFCFDTPYEFARLPDRVLYPMGCGMLVRREVLERIGPFDEVLFNYYDDTDLGIRTWQCGFQVAVARDAWIDHGFGHSNKNGNHKAFLCERNRIRTVLKYFPLRHLPAWLAHEAVMASGFDREHRSILLRAWMSNLMHLASALRLRARFSARHQPFWHLLDPSWRQFPPPGRPRNYEFRPDPARAQSYLWLDGERDLHQLNFGWYDAEMDGEAAFRCSAPQASALFKLDEPTLTCSLTLHSAQRRLARVVVRRFGSIEPALQEVVEMADSGWHKRSFDRHLAPGAYEMLLLAEDRYVDRWGRAVGIAASHIAFE